ncbi:hypothetical protein Lser_V15G29580 [Lactuca serriola]
MATGVSLTWLPPCDNGFKPLALTEDPQNLKWFVQAELLNGSWAMPFVSVSQYVDHWSVDDYSVLASAGVDVKGCVTVAKKLSRSLSTLTIGAWMTIAYWRRLEWTLRVVLLLRRNCQDPFDHWSVDDYRVLASAGVDVKDCVTVAKKSSTSYVDHWSVDDYHVLASAGVDVKGCVTVAKKLSRSLSTLTIGAWMTITYWRRPEWTLRVVLRLRRNCQDPCFQVSLISTTRCYQIPHLITDQSDQRKGFDSTEVVVDVGASLGTIQLSDMEETKAKLSLVVHLMDTDVTVPEYLAQKQPKKLVIQVNSTIQTIIENLHS